MTDLIKLAERVEALDGPDREVDAEIMFDLYAKPVGLLKGDGGPRGYLWPEDDPSWSFGIRFPGRDRGWFAKQRQAGDGERLLIERDGALVLMNCLRVPLLTASIDAAKQLVPEGWLVEHLNELGGAGGCFCSLGNPGTSQNVISDAGARTMALALTAAALRARSKT